LRAVFPSSVRALISAPWSTSEDLVGSTFDFRFSMRYRKPTPQAFSPMLVNQGMDRSVQRAASGIGVYLPSVAARWQPARKLVRLGAAR